jgi:eukaryotic-like serine/threonine-protein kinase
VSHRFPRFLPDEKHFLYLSRTVSARSGPQGDAGVKLKVASLDGTLNREIMPAESNAVYVDGYLLFTRNGFLVAQQFNPHTFEMTGEPTQIASHVRSIGGASYSLFDVSSAGVLIYQGGDTVEGANLNWVDMKGAKIGQLGEMAQYDDPIHVSPDGTQATVAIFDSRVGTPDVWVLDLKRNLRTRFTTDTAADNNPLWSPDGSKIVFSSTRRGRVDLFIKNVGGSNSEELFYSGAGDLFANAWSPDGKHVLAAQLIAGGGWNVMAIPVGGGQEKPVLVMKTATGFGACFSPNGRWLVYDSNDSGQRDAFVIPFRGSGRKWQVSTAGGFQPRWVGRHIYYFNERALMRSEVSEQDSTISIGNEETLFEVNELVDFDVALDETKLVLLQTLDEANKTPLSVVLNWTQKLPAEK